MASKEMETNAQWLGSASLARVLCDDTEFKAIVSINNVQIQQLPVRLLRCFCAKLKITGYNKNHN
jgi:hypothetical protein